MRAQRSLRRSPCVWPAEYYKYDIKKCACATGISLTGCRYFYHYKFILSLFYAPIADVIKPLRTYSPCSF